MRLVISIQVLTASFCLEQLLQKLGKLIFYAMEDL